MFMETVETLLNESVTGETGIRGDREHLREKEYGKEWGDKADCSSKYEPERETTAVRLLGTTNTAFSWIYMVENYLGGFWNHLTIF